MKRDWSIFRITVLLYAIVVLLPLNYYFAKDSFSSIQNDAETMQELVYINGAIQRLATINDEQQLTEGVVAVEDALKKIDHDFLQLSANQEYISLFRADEAYSSVLTAWMDYKTTDIQTPEHLQAAEKCWYEVNSFSKLSKEMVAYKNDTILDKLYLSLIFSMIAILGLVVFVRLYIKIQIEKHAIHDHITGLYNKKYYNEVLQKSKVLSLRQENPMSLLVLSFEHYEQLHEKMDNKKFNAFLQEFSRQFREFFRQSDTVCRIEDNVFVAVMPDINSEYVQKLAERLEKKLELHQFDLKSKIELRIGTATYEKDSDYSLLDEAIDVMKRDPLVHLGGAL